MTYPVFATGDVLNASDMNAVGLWLVKTQTIGSGVASVTVSDCFSTSYDNYRIDITGVSGTTAGAALYVTLRTSVPADNASNWKGNSVYVATGTAGGFNNANYNNASGGECGSLSTTAGQMSFDLLGPYLSQRTNVSYNNTDNQYFRVSSGVLDNATSYVSMKLVPNAGTLSGGTIRVYGYKP